MGSVGLLKVRKGEDGRVDISFYDWHYYDDSNSEYTTSIIRLTYIPSPINLKIYERMSQPPPSLILHTLTAQRGLTDYDVCIFARTVGLEPTTPSFGD